MYTRACAQTQRHTLRKKITTIGTILRSVFSIYHKKTDTHTQTHRQKLTYTLLITLHWEIRLLIFNWLSGICLFDPGIIAQCVFFLE